MSAHKIRGLFCYAAVTLALLACEEKPPEPEVASSSEQIEQDKPQEIAPKIASAMQAAVQESQSRQEAGGFEPPPNGVLDPGKAQAEVPNGASPQLVLGSSGSAPRVQLGGAPRSGARRRAELQVRLGGSVMPTVTATLRQDVPQASTAAAGAGKTANGRVFTLEQATLSAQQPGRLPPGADAVIARLGDTKFSFPVATEGQWRPGALELGKDKEDVRPLAIATLDALSTLTMPVPAEAVGTGAYWMVKSRELFNEAPAVVYRMLRVTKVEGQSVELSVNTKRYLTQARLPLAGLPPHRVQEWRSEGTGTAVLEAGQALPRRAEFEDTFLAVVVPEGAQGQAIPVQGDTKVSFASPTAP